jgi:hypothetical protein
MVVAYCDGKPSPQLSAELQAVIDRWTAGGAKVELRDEAGRASVRIGPPPAEPLYDDEPDLPDAEVERRLRESPRTTLAEFRKRTGVA